MLTKLIPYLKNFHLDAMAITAEAIILTLSTTRPSARCPVCGWRSRGIHSRYQRTVTDMPIAGKPVVLRLHVRKFFCRTRSCVRRIFTERLPDLVAPYGRKSHGLAQALRQIGVALGGEAGARLAESLGMATSPDTLLSLIRCAPLIDPGQPRVVGVDEWAWRKGVRYGTVIVDLEQHRPIALLPEREADVVAGWFQARPQLEVISRDRSGTFADAATRGAPQATQVADRFHLLRNLGEALEAFLLHKRALLKETAAIVAAALAPPVTAPPISEMYPGKRRQPKPQAWKQRLEEDSARRHERYVAAYEAVCTLHAKGGDIADIARTVGVSRRTVYRYLSMDGPPERRHPVHRPRPARLAWEAFVTQRWDEGCHNGRRLWRETRAAGHTCSESNVARFVAQLRRGLPRRLSQTRGRPLTNAQGPRARHVAVLLLRRPDRLTQEQAVYLEELCRRDPSVATAYALAQEFATMARERQGERLDDWVAQAVASEVAAVGRFAQGLAADDAAVRAGLSLAYSNGQVEGQITKIKLVRRSMYGRGKFDLLERRVLAAA